MLKVKVKVYNLENKVENVMVLFELLNELEREDKSYIRDLRIADVIFRLENILGAN